MQNVSSIFILLHTLVCVCENYYTENQPNFKDILAVLHCVLLYNNYFYIKTENFKINKNLRMIMLDNS